MFGRMESAQCSHSQSTTLSVEFSKVASTVPNSQVETFCSLRCSTSERRSGEGVVGGAYFTGEEQKFARI